MSRHAAYPLSALLLAAPAAVCAAPAASAAPVAFVEAAKGVKELGSVIRVQRGKKAVAIKGRYLNLEAGDAITLRDPRAQVTVRYLGNNAVHRVRRAAGSKEPDYRVRALEVPGLTQAVFDWLVGQLVGKADARPSQEITASSRTTRGGSACAATIDGAPAALQFRGESAQPMRLVAGGGPVPVGWIGGIGPYALDSGNVAVALAPGACFARLDAAAFAPGITTLTLRDAARAAPARLRVETVASRPPMPEVLAKAAIDEDSRALYYASWLGGLDGGVWALEAQRIALSRDCAKPAVKAWLDTAGLRAACN